LKAVGSPKLPPSTMQGLESCAPGEVGVDPKSLEDHRLRNRWQSSLGILPGLAECVIAGNRVAYLDLMGSADVERGTPVRESTLFRCFSMTKPITAVAVMRLVEDKKMSLDDPVAKYIPSFQGVKVVKSGSEEEWGVTAKSHDHVEPCKTQMTMRHLLTHTSGLAYGPDRCSPKEPLKASSAAEGSYLGLVQDVDSGRIQTLREFCDALAELPLRFQPGTQWMYSHGVDVAGRVIEVVSGRHLDAFLREEIFQPLGMSRTTFFVGRDRARDLAAMYLAEESTASRARRKGDDSKEAKEDEVLCRLKRVDGELPEDSRWCGRRTKHVIAGGGIMGSCAGGLVSCLHDMALFVCMLANGGKVPSGRQLLQPSTMRALMRDWLALSSVVGHSFGRRKALKGWPHGANVGWSPVGNIRKKDKCLYMGGWSTSWAIYPKTHLATISMSQSLVYFDVPGWVARKDELDSALEFGVAQHRRRVSALFRHRNKVGGAAGGRSSAQKAAARKGSALAVSRALRTGARKAVKGGGARLSSAAAAAVAAERKHKASASCSARAASPAKSVRRSFGASPAKRPRT